jgi:hypothetical protein
VALHGSLDDLRRRVLVHVPRLRAARRRPRPREHRRDNGVRLRALHRLRPRRVVPRRADRPDARAPDAVDLRSRRLLDRLRLHPRRAARLGGVPGEPAGHALGRLLRLGSRLHADAPLRRGDDLQQPLRVHGDQRLRALPRHTDPDPLVHLHGREGGRPLARPARRDAARERAAVLGRGHGGDRLLDVGERARLLAFRQAQASPGPCRRTSSPAPGSSSSRWPAG